MSLKDEIPLVLKNQSLDSDQIVIIYEVNHINFLRYRVDLLLESPLYSTQHTEKDSIVQNYLKIDSLEMFVAPLRDI